MDLKINLDLRKTVASIGEAFAASYRDIRKTGDDLIGDNGEPSRNLRVAKIATDATAGAGGVLAAATVFTCIAPVPVTHITEVMVGAAALAAVKAKGELGDKLNQHFPRMTAAANVAAADAVQFVRDAIGKEGPKTKAELCESVAPVAASHIAKITAGLARDTAVSAPHFLKPAQTPTIPKGDSEGGSRTIGLRKG